MTDPEIRFQQLAPPPGGEARLRRALAAHPRPNAWRGPAFAAACSLVLLIAGVAGTALRPWAQDARIAEALQVSLQYDDTPRIESGAAVALTRGRRDVRVYLVMTNAATVGDTPPN